jgi:translation initiation factor IF-2
MAKKRVHEIAKEQGMSSADVLMRLRDAGLDVTAAASTVDEAEALRALGGNGSAPAKPAARAATAAPPQQRAGAPQRAGQQRQAAPAARAAGQGAPPQQRTRRIFEPDGPPLKVPTRRQDDDYPRPPLPPRPSPTPAARPATPPPRSREAPKAAAQPAPQPRQPQAREAAPAKPAPTERPAQRPPAQQPQRQQPAEPAQPAPAAKQAAAPAAPAQPARPAQPSQPTAPKPRPREQAPAEQPAAAPAQQQPKPEQAPAEQPQAEQPQAEQPQAEQPQAKEAPKTQGTKGPKTVERPAPGTGPKIIAQPEEPKRPTRDETQSKPSRPSRGGLRDEGGPGGGRRRVVIDSQASRRQGTGPGGGPGGPGGPPGAGGPPGRRPGRRSRGRRRREVLEEVASPLAADALSRTDVVRINSGSTVRDVAEYLGVAVADIIKKLMGMGEMVTLTQTLSDEAIAILAEEFGKQVEVVHADDVADGEPEYEDSEEELVERPPVVTIMGHVDHGKTSLLDAIRETEVASGEAGGITQHIGAYQVHHGDKTITFLDTPGHEAFTAMRARGGQVADISVVVVAADDGVMPQTREAVDHSRAADVPILVAVNKVDKEGADPTRVRTEMTQLNLQPAEWGGDTEFVDVSAKTHQGLEDLLDTILVVAELEELEANPSASASGVVIESKLDPGRGPVVTLLVQRGTLHVGDALVAGAHWGRVRAMVDYNGERVDEASPGDPVEVLGFDSVPEAGEHARVADNDRAARQFANERAVRLRNEAQARRAGRKVSFEDVFKGIQEGEVPELDLVLKADVSGSLEAFEDEIARLPQDEIHVNIISSGVGGITESDVMLASASDAVILGFNVRPVGDARAAAEREDVEIRAYSVIYRALEDLRDAMTGMLAPEEVEQTVGSVEVRQTFRASRVGTIAGCYVTDGTVRRGAKVRLVRDGTVIYDTTIDSLRRFNDDVREVAAGYECGIVLANYQDVKEGDVLEVYETRQVERALA